MPETYLLSHRKSNPDEDARLDRQHIYVKSLIDKDQLLYPEAQDAQVVGDIGCGTGVWLNDVARTYKCKRLVGWDVNPSRFVAAREENVEFLVWDGTTDPEKEFEGVFDVVNIRVLWPAVTVDGWKVLVGNALKLLKPGGYLQWLEGEFANLVITPPSEAFDRTIELLDRVRRKRQLATHIPTTMLRTLLDLNVEILHFDLLPIGNEQVFDRLSAAGLGTRAEFSGLVLSSVKFVLENMVQDNLHDEEDYAKLLRFFEAAEKEPEKWSFEAGFPKLLARKGGRCPSE